MGGAGSGDWYRWDTKITTDKVKRIDIRYMKKRGLLHPYNTGTLSWTRGGVPNGNISYNCHQDRLELNFRYREYGGDWQPVHQTIHFDRTPCNYGGERLWLLCPRCSRRVGLLYNAHRLFLCRHCYHLSYSSQQEGHINNAISQKHKLGERIFEHYEFGEGYGKKKGMHWKTFNRLYEKYQQHEQQWCLGVARYITDLDI